MQQIYTIPINEHFDACRTDRSLGCPVCSLYRMLEENELDIIMGASMMEPDIRIKTNKMGFCATHNDMMFERKNRLSVALMLESHLDELRRDVDDMPLLVRGSRARQRIAELESDCYVCSRVEAFFENVADNVVYMWGRDAEFREKFADQPYFCLPHWRLLLELAKKRLPKKQYNEFADASKAVVLSYFDTLRDDVSLFCKKFDYRYGEVPWGNSKDSVERAMRFLRSDIHRKVK